MPDEYGRLSAADYDLIEGWWTQHSKEPVICPVCKTTDWKIAGHLINIPSHATATDANASDTSTYPHIVVICKFCAHSMFFNAAQIGIAVPPTRRPSAGAAGSDLMEQRGILGLTRNLADLINKKTDTKLPPGVRAVQPWLH